MICLIWILLLWNESGRLLRHQNKHENKMENETETKNYNKGNQKLQMDPGVQNNRFRANAAFHLPRKSEVRAGNDVEKVANVQKRKREQDGYVWESYCRACPNINDFWTNIRSFCNLQTRWMKRKHKGAEGIIFFSFSLFHCSQKYRSPFDWTTVNNGRVLLTTAILSIICRFKSIFTVYNWGSHL